MSHRVRKLHFHINRGPQHNLLDAKEELEETYCVVMNFNPGQIIPPLHASVSLTQVKLIT